MDEGLRMYNLIKELFPICRSITGNGVRQTLNIISREIPELKICEVPTGTKVFDWTVPKEWNITSGYIESLSGKRIIDFEKNNLHVLGYSLAIDRIVTKDELLQMVYTLPEQPDAIPYVTSYYKERVGFCMSEIQKNMLNEDSYHVVIKSTLEDGSLTYGELLIEGESKQEVFFSTYICHPSMANNELSGPGVAVELVKYIKSLPLRRYSYRIIFIPETIGSITYLSKNINYLKKYVIAGFNISCVGDDRTYSYIESPYADTLADKVAQNVLKFHYPDYKRYSFLQRGSDERQYCSPGVSLPLCAICRSKYGEYSEYHTSLDNLSLVTQSGLQGAFDVYRKCVDAIEYNRKYESATICEPQLGIRGLYPTISYKGSDKLVRNMMNFIVYADGEHDLIDISNKILIPIESLIPIVKKLTELGLILCK